MGREREAVRGEREQEREKRKAAERELRQVRGEDSKSERKQRL